MNDEQLTDLLAPIPHVAELARDINTYELRTGDTARRRLDQALLSLSSAVRVAGALHGRPLTHDEARPVVNALVDRLS